MHAARASDHGHGVGHRRAKAEPCPSSGAAARETCSRAPRSSSAQRFGLAGRARPPSSTVPATRSRPASAACRSRARAGQTGRETSGGVIGVFDVVAALGIERHRSPACAASACEWAPAAITTVACRAGSSRRRSRGPRFRSPLDPAHRGRAPRSAPLPPPRPRPCAASARRGSGCASRRGKKSRAARNGGRPGSSAHRLRRQHLLLDAVLRAARSPSPRARRRLALIERRGSHSPEQILRGDRRAQLPASAAPPRRGDARARPRSP